MLLSLAAPICESASFAADARLDSFLAAESFLEALCCQVFLDLANYHQSRSGAYGENWYPLPGNPWTPEKFDQVRRLSAEHIAALRAGGD
jgi:hypothetical protein